MYVYGNSPSPHDHNKNHLHIIHVIIKENADKASVLFFFFLQNKRTHIREIQGFPGEECPTSLVATSDLPSPDVHKVRVRLVADSKISLHGFLDPPPRLAGGTGESRIASDTKIH